MNALRRDGAYVTAPPLPRDGSAPKNDSQASTGLADTPDTTESGFAARYAQALYDAAFEQNRLDATIDEMASLGRLIEESGPLRRLLADRLADIGKAGPVLNQALQAQGFSALVRNFVQVALANRRAADLPALIRGFATYVAAKRGEMIADITSAHPLSDLQRTQLRARLTEAGYGRVNLREAVDSAVLGGLSVKIGAKLYDTTLRSRLERLTYSLKGAA